MSAGEYLKRLFLVRKCISCREILDYKHFDGALCAKCRDAFEAAKTQSCPKCFGAACECSCQPSMLSKSGSLTLRKLFFYSAENDNEPQNKLIYFLKHNPNKRGFEFCAEQIWNMLKDELESLELKSVCDEMFVVNMPRGRASVRQYGFDQSAEICKALSRISGIPYVKALSRKNGGKEQKKLNAAQRRENVSGKIYPHEKALVDVNGKYAILFDDVVTTGASMESCIKILRKMQVKGVICVALATDLKNKGAR